MCAKVFLARSIRHKSLDVLREYVRREEWFEDHAAEWLHEPNHQ